MQYVLLEYAALLLQSLHRHRVHHVEHNREQGAGHVDAQRHPPQELFVQLLLKVLQHQQANGQTGQRTRQVRHVRNGRRTRILRRVP